MKNRFSSMLVIMIFAFSQFLIAQKDIKPPKAPIEPNFNYDFEFSDLLTMSEEDEKELLKNLNKELRADLEVIKKTNKERYFEFLRESQFKNMEIPFIVKREKVMYERDKNIFEAEIKVEAYAAKYKSANNSEKEKLKRQLGDELSKLFEQKEARRKEEVADLENELKELKKSLEIRQKNKRQIIERRIQELLEEDEYLEWD